jgi:chromosome segregation ATPase
MKMIDIKALEKLIDRSYGRTNAVDPFIWTNDFVNQAAAELAELKAENERLEKVYQLAVHEAYEAVKERNLARHNLDGCRHERDDRTTAIAQLRAQLADKERELEKKDKLIAILQEGILSNDGKVQQEHADHIKRLEKVIDEQQAELDEARKVIERHVEWLENVDHDYSNGNSAFGCDEGAVLGQRGESQLLASSHAYLASHPKDGEK